MTNAGLAYLVDTNVLICAYDQGDPAKRRRAVEVLTALRRARIGAFSVQILGEFYTNVTRKPVLPLTPEQARATSVRLCRSWPVMDLTVRTYLEAVRGVAQHRLSYWDALVWATAKQSMIPNIVTEDGQHGQLIEEIRYLNPFTPSFDPATLVP